MGRIIKNGLMSLMAIAAVMAVGIMASPVSAQVCPGPIPPAFPTELDVNLLNSDGSNIDTSLPLTIDYLDSNGCPLYLSSVEDTADWSIYNGLSNAYSLVPALDGTDINITVEGYEILQIAALPNGYVSGDYYLADTFPPYITKNYTPDVFINKNWNINITWTDDETGVSTAWLVRNDTGPQKYFPDGNVTNSNEIEFSWNSVTENRSGVTINVTAYAIDTNNNTNQTSFTYTVVDTTKIELDPVQDYYNTTNINITGTTSTTANVSYSLNRREWVSIDNGTTIFSISINESNGIVPDKLNNLTVYAVNYYDENDNATENVSFYVDVTPPDISYNPSTTPSGVHSQNWTFVNVSVSDNMNLDTITLEVTGPSNTTNFSSWDDNDGVNYWKNISFPDDGQYTFRVYANDSAENTNVTTPPRTVILDTAPPFIKEVLVFDPVTKFLAIVGESASLTYQVSDLTTAVNWSGYSLNGGATKTLNPTGDGNYTYTFDRLPNGPYTITVYANDTAGNMIQSTVDFLMRNGILNSADGSIDDNGNFKCTGDKTICGGIAIENVTEGVTGSVNVTRFSRVPDGINPLNQTYDLLNGYVASGIYIRINHTLTGNFSALLRIYYKNSDFPSNVNFSELKIFRYNSTAGAWKVLLNSTVNTTGGINGYDGYVQATVTNFSYFSFGGMLIPSVPEPRGSSSYRPYVPKFIPTVILTSSTDWHYAMLAAGFAAANDYAVLVNPSMSLELAVKNNIQWFRRLIIFGGESIISNGIEGTIKNLSDALEPGFFGMDVIRVNGSNYYDASTLLVDKWRDPKGSLTAKGIILTRGDVFADTLAASQLSAATSSPIIYTSRTRLLPGAKDRILELGLDVTIIGGEEAISPEVEKAVKALGVNVKRIGGKDRYETAALVADEYVKAMENKGKTVDTVTFLSGETGDWASTLGARSYEQNSVILFVKNSSRTDEFPEVNKNFMASHPGITTASIWVESDGNVDDFASTDSYLRSIDYGVDPNKGNSYQMNRGDMEKDYKVQLSPVSLSTSVTGEVRKSQKNSGTMLIPGEAAGGSGGMGGGSKYIRDPEGS